MKRISSLLVAMFLTLAISIQAENVSVQTAQTAARSFLNAKMGNIQQISLVDFAERADFPNLYVFGNEHCFVIIAGDDAVHPVLGYSTEGGLGMEDIPENAYEWLKAYEEDIAYIKAERLSADEEIRSEWNRLLSGKGLEPKSRSHVGPLLTTYWNQRAPYNNLCPPDSTSSSGHESTGCVATAMAQVMNYWEHPVRGVGSHSYTLPLHPEYGVLYANFGATTYDWDNMRNHYAVTDYTEIEAFAVATLMYHCGVSIEIGYGSSSGSSGYMGDAASALRTYFDYSPNLLFEFKTQNGYVYYTDYQWISKLKYDLNLGRPLPYRSYHEPDSVRIGHSFVCDGYDEYDFFHFNWGWGGIDDGFYMIGALNPSSQPTPYTRDNAAIFNCYPNTPSINAPTNVNATASGRNVSVSWNSVSNASYYKLYRDGNLIANNLHTTSYTDNNVCYGEHFYYVKSVKSDGTMSLMSNKAEVEVHFPGPAPTNLQATTNGHNVNLSWQTENPESAILQYGTGNMVSSLGYNDGNYFAHRFRASSLSDYAGMAINKVAFYFRYAGTYTLYIYQGEIAHSYYLTPIQTYEATAGSWQDIVLSSPFPIDCSKDLWIIFHSSVSHPASYCSYSGPDVADASLFSHYGTAWGHRTDRSWLIKTYITDGTYTYNLYRDGNVVANNLTGNTHTDSNLPDGFYDYHVTTNYFGGESDPSNTVHVQVGNPTYTINASVNPTNGGTVSGAGTYNYGQTCNLSATAANGYNFINWTENGSVVSSNASYSFTVNTNRTLVANFQLQSYTISASANPTTGGAVSGAGTYNYGQTCNLNATPANGYNFVNWTENGSVVSSNTSYSFTVNANRTLVANFQLQSYTISASANPTNGGSVSGAGTYNHGQTCTLSATPSNGYNFVNWTENGSVVSSNASYSFSVNANRTLVANFQLDSFVVSVDAEPANGGSVTGGGAFHFGDNCTVIATANPGFNFVNWTENGNVVSVNDSYSFTVNANHSLVAHFTSQNYVITAIADPTEAGTVTGAGGYNYGETCTLNASANAGYTYINWTRNGSVVSTNPSYSFTVTESASFVAHFSAQSFTVGVTVNPSEGGTVSGGGQYTYGQQCTVHASASPCYQFTNWTENGSVVSTSPDYTFTVTANRNLVANFTLLTYTVTVDIEPAEGGHVVGVGAYDCGESVTLEAVANENYSFVGWLENGDMISTLPMMTFAATADRHLTARFAFIDGIEENGPSTGSGADIEVYPNPANDVLYIVGEGIKKVMVFNTLGQVVESLEFELQDSVAIDSRRYVSGLYILLIEVENGLMKKKFVKQ